MIDTKLKEVRENTSNKYASTTCSATAVTKDKKKALIDTLDRVNDSNKWVLSTGKIVDDVFKQIISCSVFEHPVHSFTLESIVSFQLPSAALPNL